MTKYIEKSFVNALNLSCAQTDWMRVLSGTIKAGQAMTITDEELANIVHEFVPAILRIVALISPPLKLVNLF